MNGNPSSLFCILPRDDSSRFFPPGTAPVCVNVYEISTISSCISWTGIGAFHTGLEGNRTSIFFNHFPPISNSNRSFRLITVHGVEYGFGCHQESEIGVFEIEPRKCPRFKFLGVDFNWCFSLLAPPLFTPTSTTSPPSTTAYHG